MKIHLALNMIVKGDTDPAMLEKCLLSIVHRVDEVGILETWTPRGSTRLKQAAVDVCNEYSVPLTWGMWKDEECHPDEHWTHDFSEARNKALELLSDKATHWCYIDADTVLVHGDLWIDDVRKWFGDEGENEAPRAQMEVRYDYDHIGERCVRRVGAKMVHKRGTSKWEHVVHEQARISVAPVQFFDAREQPYYLRHGKSRSGGKESARRNLWILEKFRDESDGQMSGRMWSVYAAALMGAGRFEEAVPAFDEVVAADTDSEERYTALVRKGTTLIELGRVDEALEAYACAAAKHPERATPWVYMATVYKRQGLWHEAIVACERAAHFLGVDEGQVSNPSFIEAQPVNVRARSLEGMGQYGEAAEAYERLLGIAGEDDVELALQASGDRDRCLSKARSASSYAALKKASETAGDSVWENAPEELAAYPEVIRAKMPKAAEGQETVMVYCGPSLKQWGPSSLSDGLGGSEEAVVYLSRELAAQGFHVEVYGLPEKEDFGMDDYGVVWVPHYAWEDKPGIFIEWRSCKEFYKATKASKRYVWLHDKVNYTQFYTDRAKAMLDGVFVLSKNHAQPLIDHGWEDKLIYTTNGLDPAYFIDGMERPRRSFAFYSSPDRGLDALLEAWPKIRTDLPDATLDIFYGFNEHYLRAMQTHPHLRDVKSRIEGMMKDRVHQGVTWRGMVGHRELAESMGSTAFWLYPTEWPETSCITAMKCMANGCIPITSGYEESGAVETIGGHDLGPETPCNYVYTDPKELDRWVESVILAARTEEDDLPINREEMSAWARETYRWATVAEAWATLFRSTAPSTAPSPQKEQPQPS